MVAVVVACDGGGLGSGAGMVRVLIPDNKLLISDGPFISARGCRALRSTLLAPGPEPEPNAKFIAELAADCCDGGTLRGPGGRDAGTGGADCIEFSGPRVCIGRAAAKSGRLLFPPRLGGGGSAYCPWVGIGGGGPLILWLIPPLGPGPLCVIPLIKLPIPGLFCPIVLMAAF